jgi:hypothetical protein
MKSSSHCVKNHVPGSIAVAQASLDRKRGSGASSAVLEGDRKLNVSEFAA